MELLNKQHVSEHDSGNVHTDHSQPSSHTALLTGKACLLSCTELCWILDSGATDHITNSLSDFSTYKPVSDYDSTITIPDGSQV